MELYKLSESYFNQPRRPVTSHYASSATSCLRKLYYQWIEEPVTNPPTTANYVKMDFGRYAEDFAERLLLHACEIGEIEALQHHEKKHIKIPELQFPVAVEYDFLIYNNKGKYLLECKSSFGRKTRDIKNTGELPEDYLVQALFYMTYFDTPFMKMWYLSRDDGYMAEYKLVLRHSGNDAEISYLDVGKPKEFLITDGIQKYVNRFIELEKHIALREAPPRDYHLCIVDGKPQKQKIRQGQVVEKSDWQCFSYCSYRDTCWGIK